MPLKVRMDRPTTLLGRKAIYETRYSRKRHLRHKEGRVEKTAEKDRNLRRKVGRKRSKKIQTFSAEGRREKTADIKDRNLRQEEGRKHERRKERRHEKQRPEVRRKSARQIVVLL